MSEIKKPIVFLNSDQINVQQLDGFLIEEAHTIADIARWVIDQDWQDELIYQIGKQQLHG